MINDPSCTRTVWAAAASRFMSRALTDSFGAGTAAAVWSIVDYLDSPRTVWFQCSKPSFWDIHLPSLIVGVAIGLALGPVLEALVLLRAAILRQCLQRLVPQEVQRRGPVRPLFLLDH